MARPITIRDETIIEAARSVFLERGIQGTTAEVALRAGVSEGSIFKRFASKEELFRAAMQSRLVERTWLRHLRAGASSPDDDVRGTLRIAATEAIDFFRQILPLMMMAWSNPGGPGEATMFPGRGEPPPVLALRTVREYLAAQMEAGRIARHDPDVLARLLLGGIIHFTMFEAITRAMSGAAGPTAERYVDELIDVLWRGAAPKPSAARRAANGRGPRPRR